MRVRTIPDVRLIDANATKEKLGFAIEPFIGSTADEIRNDTLLKAIAIVDSMPTVDAQPVKHGHWSECYRDSRCISVICSVCKNPTVTAHGCRDADEVTMDYVIEKLPHCPKCCSDMRGDADETP